MSPADEPKRLTPRQEFELLRVHMEWRIRTMGLTREERRGMGKKEREALGKKTQQEIVKGTGLSVGKISDIVRRADARGLADTWPEVVGWLYEDIEGALSDTRRWRGTALGQAEIAESLGPRWLQDALKGKRSGSDSESVLGAIKLLADRKIVLDDAGNAELRRLAAEKPERSDSHLAALVEVWHHGEGADTTVMRDLTRRDSSRPLSVTKMRRPDRK